MPLRTKLIVQPPRAWPRAAGWLADHNSTPLQRRIVQRAHRDPGILETPLGSNNGIRVGAYIRRAGLKPPVYWCACYVGAVWADAGALIPQDYPSCDAWLPYLVSTPVPGAAVLYGPSKRDATHIEIVARVDTMLLVIGGNRGAPGANTNNGIGVFGPIPQTRRDVLGYVVPREVPDYTPPTF